jgi:hypothetical protein
MTFSEGSFVCRAGTHPPSQLSHPVVYAADRKSFRALFCRALALRRFHTPSQAVRSYLHPIGDLHDDMLAHTDR